MKKVSIIIPVYNVEKYIGDCVESTINQTLNDIEIICVDDASTDSSLSIIQKYAKQDKRIKVISYKNNKSASQARKDGVLQAEGAYIMFLDGDDYLEVDACEKLYNVISKKKVDMVHFGTNVINEGRVSEQRITNLEKLLKPYNGMLKGSEVFTGCFIEKKYRFSIWNKIYEAEFCKKAFLHVKDGNFPKAQDLYAFFILCYFATSYYGIDETCYNYRFGAGITGNRKLNLPQLERYCLSVLVVNEIGIFLHEQQEEQYKDVLQQLRKGLLNDCANNWYIAVSEEESSIGFDILAKYWEPEELVSYLCEKHYFDRKRLAAKILGAKSINCKITDDIKTIGIFYHRYALGGVQRVISLLIPMYMEMGYHVVLFTDEISEEDEYELPAKAVRVVLPSSLEIKKDEYIIRAEKFVKYLKEYNVDVMCYHAASSAKLVFDLLLLKMHNIPVVLTVHEVAFQNMLTMNTEMVSRPVIFKLADYITVLSRVEEAYWKNLGIHAVYIPNPVTQRPVKRNPVEIEKNTIVWIGRLDTRTKRCLDIVDIMKYVAEEIPDARLLVVGNEVSTGITKMIQQKIRKNGVEKNVILCGHSTNVGEYYKKAEIYMITSISESFSMTIAESKSYGIPLVMYELPFIELCRNHKGYLSAPQGDKKKMAENIITILKDKALKEKLQQEAQESILPFLEFDFKKAWNQIFHNLNKASVSVEADETVNLLLRSVLQHYNYGTTINNNEKTILRKKSNELTKLKKTWDYKLGHTILYIPHRIVWGVRKLIKRNTK